MDFKNIVESRYAVKSFDGRLIPAEKITLLMEMLRLAPTSFNLQPWRVKVITDPQIKEKLKPVSWNQPQITTSSHLFVFCANTQLDLLTDRLEQRLLEEAQMPADKVKIFTGLVRKFIGAFDESQRLAWASKQAYIALSNGMNGAKALGFDSCPIEGFDSKAYHEILQLPENLVPIVIMAVGYANDIPRPKLRFLTEEMFF